MKIKCTFFLLVVFLVNIASPVSSLRLAAAKTPSQDMLSSGSLSLPQTGQTTSYISGDDGDLKIGVAWPSPRFADNANGTLTDKLTGLIWAKNAGNPGTVSCTGGPGNWQGALDYVACLNTHAYLGFNDWRLPNIVEMQSLFNDDALNSITWLTGQGFSGVQTYYWSSTTYAGSVDTAWTVILWSAPQVTLFDPKTATTYYTWPVRGTTTLPAQLRQTGQTVSFAAGDDGQLQAGVTLQGTRFTADTTGGCLTDQLTGLMWVRSPLSTLRTWPEAMDYANTLNLCGYSDWHLPNRQELRSLVNFGETLNAPVLNAQGFIGIKNRQYWTSTTNAYDTGTAWSIDLGTGLDNFAYKPDTYTKALLSLGVRSGSTLPPGGHSLSGRVSRGGAGLAGVALTLVGPVTQFTQTGANGNYTFAGLPDGSYTLSPAKIYHGFNPAQRTLTLSGADTSGMDFSAALTTNYGLVDLSDNQAGVLNGNNTILEDIRHTTKDGITLLLFGSVNPSRVYRTTDGAATLEWANLKHGVQELSMLPDGQTAFAVGGAYGSKTLDGGQTWTKVTIGGTLDTVFFANASVGYAAGNSGVVYRTGDGGGTWVRKTAPGNLSFSILSVWAPEGNVPDMVYAAIANAGTTVFKSLDGGDTWSAMTLPGTTSAIDSFFFKDASTGWAAGGDGNIFKFNGSVWTKKATPVTVTLNAIAFAPDGLYGWAVGNQGVILRTTDGGETWSQVGTELGIREGLTGVTVVSDSEVYIVGSGNTLLKYQRIAANGAQYAVYLPLLRK